MTVDADIVREHFETDLGDDAIDRLIADAVAFCDVRAGTAGEQSMVVQAGERYLILPQPIAAASDLEITERWGSQTTLLVEDTDWRWLGGRAVERLSGGSVVYWGFAYGCGDILVTYTPRDDSDRRDRVVIDLVKLAVQFNALDSETAGDYSARGLSYAQERDRIVRQLVSGMAIA